MSSTLISLLDCTHLYDKIAVRERYHAAFAVTWLVWVSEGLCSGCPVISSTIVVNIHLECFIQFQPPPHTTCTEYNLLMGYV